MLKIIQITDCHLVPEDQSLFTLDPADRLRQAIADIDENHADAELCVLTGDLANDGHPQAYALLRDILGDLRMPYRLLAGNHDDRDRLCAAFPQIETDAHGFLQSALSLPAGVLLFLDTVEAGLHSGVYCERRCEWLETALTAAGDRPVHLFMHHPPMDIGMPRLDQYRIRENAAFADVVRRFPNIRHIFFGHLHRPISGGWLGIPVSSISGTNHQNALDLSEGRANIVSLGPPVYGVILIGCDGTIVHHHDFASRARRFRYEPTAHGETVEEIPQDATA